MVKNVVLAIVVLVVLAGGFWYLKKNKTEKMMMSAPSPTQVAVSPTAAPTMAEKSGSSSATVKEVTITGANFSFDPSTITVKKGDTVKITLNNSEGLHDFVIDDFNVKIGPITAGQTKSAQFVADKTGSFEYYCSIGNHRQMGMKGTLVVQ